MSYYQILKLEREPFSTSPDPAFFYRSNHHRAALANLLIELRLKRGLSVVLGNIGTGKTTLGRKLIHMLRERTGFLFHIILNPVYHTEELFFDALCRRLGIEMTVKNPSLVDYSEGLERFLYQKGIVENQTVTLIIDEAHKLTPSSLEALRILLNYETNDNKLFQLILLGQMELLPLLQGMPNLNDRISMKYILQPLNLEETQQMIEFRLREAGYCSRAPLFSEDAIREIHQYTQGYPRRISLICHRALRFIVMRDESMVSAEVLRELIQQDMEVGWTPTKILQKSASFV